MNAVIVLIVVLTTVLLLGWLGLKVRPRPFGGYAQRTPALDTIPLPAGLPAPVERFFRTVYGDQVPVIETVVATAQATIRPMFNLPLPARFVFVHEVGRNYRHYAEATWFNVPILRVDEGYVDGKSFFEAPVGHYHDDPNTNQGANLALWAEGAWFPSLWITDPRVRWVPVDDHTALLYVPFEDGEENFVVRFNPQTHLLDSLEAMRYRNPGDRTKILWITRTVEGPTIPGSKLGAVGSATWLDKGKPWAVFTLEDVVYNVDVSEYIRKRGL